MKNRRDRVVIVGAGVAGLTLACLLTRDGWDVTVIEREPAAGGLARSFSYDGFVFDIGPHRFHTDDGDVLTFIRTVLGGDCLEIPRKSGVWMFGRYFDWPLRFPELRKFPLPVIFSVASDMFRKRNQKRDTFEEYITGNYGETLYRCFFRPYTEKFLKMPCSEVSADWAETGIDRAVIDRRVQAGNLTSLIQSAIRRKPPLTFLYPKSGGITVFAEKLLRMTREGGGRVLTGANVSGLETRPGLVHGVGANGVQIPCDHLVWTAPVGELLVLLGEKRPDLEYLSLLLYNYRIAHPPLTDYQWCYYGSSDIPFNRISFPSLFNPALAPGGRSGMCVEVTCRTDDMLWERAEDNRDDIENALVAVGALRSRGDIIGIDIERIANAYPIYALGYADRYRQAAARAGMYRNTHLLGRTGTFWYNNMDHSIHAALSLHRKLTSAAL